MTIVNLIDSAFVGQDFDEFLAQEGIVTEVEEHAIQKVMVGLAQGNVLKQSELA